MNDEGATNDVDPLDRPMVPFRLAALRWRTDGIDTLTINEIDLLIEELDRSEHVAFVLGDNFWLAKHGFTVELSKLRAAKFILERDRSYKDEENLP